MVEQLAYTIIAASIGLISAVLFCVGSVLNSPKKILDQATPFWGFSEPIARALAEQRSQYIVGALLLVVAFALQVVAVLASSSIPIVLPTWAQKWYWLVVATLLSTAAVAMVLVHIICRISIVQILRLADEKALRGNAAERKDVG